MQPPEGRALLQRLTRLGAPLLEKIGRDGRDRAVAMTVERQVLFCRAPLMLGF